MEPWILCTLFAVVAQVGRTGIQKSLTTRLAILPITLARSLFGFPVAVGLFLLASLIVYPEAPSPFTLGLLLWSSFAAVAQVAASALHVSLLKSQSFAVGNSLIKVEAIFVLLVGVLFFGERITPLGVLAVVVGAIGVLLASRFSQISLDKSALPTVACGLAASLIFAFTALSVRAGIRSAPQVPILISSLGVLGALLAVQAALLGSYLRLFHPRQLSGLRGNISQLIKVGVLSSLGSACWFLAFGLENPAYVKTLGQGEVFLTLLVGKHHFRDNLSASEVGGVFAMMVSVLLLLW